MYFLCHSYYLTSKTVCSQSPIVNWVAPICIGYQHRGYRIQVSITKHHGIDGIDFIRLFDHTISSVCIAQHIPVEHHIIHGLEFEWKRNLGEICVLCRISVDECHIIYYRIIIRVRIDFVEHLERIWSFKIPVVLVVIYTILVQHASIGENYIIAINGITLNTIYDFLSPITKSVYYIILNISSIIQPVASIDYYFIIIYWKESSLERNLESRPFSVSVRPIAFKKNIINCIRSNFPERVILSIIFMCIVQLAVY